MTTCINLLASDVWSEEDIVAHGRAIINAQVTMERQQELQTIMLGHISAMRVASAAELTEIATVAAITEAQSLENVQARAAITEAQSLENVQARADMALLSEVLAFEADPTGPALGIAAQALYDLRHPVEVVNA